mgnify:CR=1 FL=1
MNRYLDEWLFLMETDLCAARELMKSPLFHISVYHAHQAAEKALKSLLIFHGDRKVPKTHALTQLFIECVKKDPKLSEALELAVIQLDEFLPRTRYPKGDRLDHDDAVTAMELSDEIVKFVSQYISERC